MFGPLRQSPYEDESNLSAEGRLRSLERRMDALEAGLAHLDQSTRVLAENLTRHTEEWCWWRVFFDRLWRVFGYELY